MTEKQLFSLDKNKFKRYFTHVFDLIAKRSKNITLSTDQFNKLLGKYDTLKLFSSFGFLFSFEYLYELFESIMDDDSGNIDWNKMDFNDIFGELFKSYVENVGYYNFNYPVLEWLMNNTDKQNILKNVSGLGGNDKELYIFIIYVLDIINYEEVKSLDKDIFPLRGEIKLDADELSKISNAESWQLDNVFNNESMWEDYSNSVDTNDRLSDLNLKNLDLLRKYFIGEEDITEENYENMEEDTLIDLIGQDDYIYDLLREIHEEYATSKASEDWVSDLENEVGINYDDNSFTFTYDLLDYYTNEDLIHEVLNCGMSLICLLKESSLKIKIRFPDYYDFNLYGDEVKEFNAEVYRRLSYIDKPDFVINRTAQDTFNKIIKKLKLTPKYVHTSSGTYKHLENELIAIDVYDQENAKNGKLYVHIVDKQHNGEYDGYASPKDIVTYLKNYRLF